MENMTTTFLPLSTNSDIVPKPVAFDSLPTKDCPLDPKLPATTADNKENRSDHDTQLPVPRVPFHRSSPTVSCAQTTNT